jgi:dihydroxyacetone kinase DhaKLM complex PTS-EIIA-like component DhaM
MAGPELRLEGTGGTADGSLGTDAMAIMAAIQAVDGGAGVVVLADLGSAVLATHTALEMMDPEAAARVRLSRGPLVEGAVVAAVQASIGDDLDTVLASADAAAGLDKLAR